MEADPSGRRVMVVHDQMLTAESLCGFIQRSLGYETALAKNAVDALVEARRFKPDIVVLDLNLKKADSEAHGRYRTGRETLLSLRREHPNARVLMISVEKTPYALWDTLTRCDAAGFVNADDGPARLLQAIEVTVLRGRWEGPGDAECLRYMKSLRITMVREQTLRLRASGLARDAIAVERGVRPASVIDALRAMQNLFGVSGELALIARARELGFFPAFY